MIDTAIQNALLKEVEQLAPPLQQKVVDYAHALVQPRPRGTPGKELLEFAGILSPKEAKEMMDAIKEGCERIDPNEW